ncbi:MAG: hypothetical protein H8E62_04610 [Planctomycetes bacterium]|nr:hypothetical protein [Planctomycetota bacterium]
MSRSRILVIVFSVTAFMIVTIHLRTSSARMFNRSRIAMVEQKERKQQLWQKQLRFECLVNPAGLPASNSLNPAGAGQ